MKCTRESSLRCCYLDDEFTGLQLFVMVYCYKVLVHYEMNSVWLLACDDDDDGGEN